MVAFVKPDPDGTDDPGARALFRAFDALGSGVCVFDREGRYVFVNATAGRMLGRAPGELIGRRYLDQEPAKEGDTFDRTFRAVVADGEARRFEHHAAATGHHHEIEVADGGAWILVLWQDVTERADLERRLQEGIGREKAARAEVEMQQARWEDLFRQAPAQVHARREIEALAAERGRLLDALAEERAVLARSEARLSRMFDANLVGNAFWRIEGPIFRANDAFLRMLGYTRADLEAGLVDWRRLTPPGYEGSNAAHVEQLLRTGVHPPYEKEFLHKDGSRVPVLVSSACFPDRPGEGIAYVVDLTAVKRAEAAVRRSEERYRSLVEASTNLVWSADGEGRLLEDSPSFRAFTGRTLEQIQGFGWLDTIHPDDRDAVAARWREAIVSKRPYAVDHRLQRADGTWAMTAVHAVPMLERDGTVREWVGTNTDITAQRRSEDERARLLVAEREARAAAEAANRAKDGFLAIVSHELRTPLSAMLGWSRMLRTGILPPERTESALAAIERNALVQTQIVEDLLDISRIVAGKLRLDVEPIELAPILAAAADAVRPAMEAKRIRFEPHVEPGAGPVLGDAARLQQVVWNLLANAAKFTPPAGRVALALRREGDEITITVTDDGPGVPPELAPRLFTAFQQADMSTTRAHGGLGLGLAISRHIVELHGGSIRAQGDASLGGAGATFVVRLPLAPDRSRSNEAARAALRAAAMRAIEVPPELRGLRVLLVDDQEDIRDFAASVLAANGAEVTAVSSAREAREAVQRALPAIVLCDIAMPGEDGFAFVKWLRDRAPHEGGRVPCGALSAYAGAADRKRILDAGYNLHVPKPVEPEELTQAVRGLARMARAVG